ncbi:MAG: FmdB family zinc ribbon protein [Planctomycetota bacterium]
MPTYDYVCDACGHAFEEFQSMTAKVLKKCPACGKMKLRRLIGTGAGVIFKGGGFYETDYRSESYQKDAKADKPAEKKSDSKSGGTKKTESKSSESKPKTEAKKPAAKKDTGS